MSLPQDGGFVPVVSCGHSGTKKLAHILNFPEHGMLFRHQWQNRIGRNPDDPFFEHDYYYDLVRDCLTRFRVFGDAKGWDYEHLPYVHERLPFRKLVHLIRNGVHVVWSTHRYSPKPDERYDDWAKVCALWAANTVMADERVPWVRAAGIEIRSCRIEDLAGETGRGAAPLRELVDWLLPGNSIADEELAAKQAPRVNRHDPQSERRTPEAIWTALTDEERDTFERICGEAMAQFGYAMPRECSLLDSAS
jgi:hypothetical protein